MSDENKGYLLHFLEYINLGISLELWGQWCAEIKFFG